MDNSCNTALGNSFTIHEDLVHQYHLVYYHHLRLQMLTSTQRQQQQTKHAVNMSEHVCLETGDAP